MPHFLIILIEVLVRLTLLAIALFGTYYLFKGMKNRHAILGAIVGVVSLSIAVNMFIPSSYAAKNRITFQHSYTSAESESNESHAESASESRDAASESRAKEAEKKSLESAKRHAKQSTGLYGLKYQVKKALKSEHVQNYDVTVLGQVDSKPYTANVFLQDKDVSGFKYDNAKMDAISVLNGIQHFKYNGYKKIGVIFTADTIDSYGQKNKKTPLVKYQLTPKTIKKVNTDNVDNLAPIADYYWKSQISDKK